MLSSYVKVLVGPDVARGPYVAQAWLEVLGQMYSVLKMMNMCDIIVHLFES